MPESLEVAVLFGRAVTGVLVVGRFVLLFVAGLIAIGMRQPPEGFSVGAPSGCSVSGGRTDVPSGAPPEVVSGASVLVSPSPAPLGRSSGSLALSVIYPT